ncbi:MAG: hypothetical protein KA419_04510 [Acidobacteria bacterium]|nr:hypothetical protein [Acidobacteriota bacterium]
MRNVRIGIGLAVLVAGVSFAAGKNDAARIVSQNVEATLGKVRPENLGGVLLVLREPTGGVTRKYCIQGPGRIRVELGQDPLVESAIGYDGKEFRGRGFAAEPVLKDTDRSDLRLMGSLASAGFSLHHFRGKLTLKGTRSLGPEMCWVLEGKVGPASVEFCVAQSGYLLRQAILTSNPGNSYDNYKIIYEFSAVRDLGGLKLPGGFFLSDLGAQSTGEFGGEFEIQAFETGKKWPEASFRDLELNFGKNVLEGSTLTGNTTFAVYPPDQGRAIIYTNLTHESMKKAGWPQGSPLSVEIGGRTVGVFYTENQEGMTPEMTVAGSGVLTPSRRMPYGVLLLYGEGFKDLPPGLKPLSEIRITRKQKEEPCPK